MPGRVAQSLARLADEPDLQVRHPYTHILSWNLLMKSFLRSFPPPTDSRKEVVSYCCKYGHFVPINRLGGLSLTKNSVARLNGLPDMTIAVYHGR